MRTSGLWCIARAWCGKRPEWKGETHYGLPSLKRMRGSKCLSRRLRYVGIAQSGGCEQGSERYDEAKSSSTPVLLCSIMCLLLQRPSFGNEDNASFYSGDFW